MALEIAFAIPSGFLNDTSLVFELGSQTLLMTVRQVGPLCNLPSLELLMWHLKRIHLLLLVL